MFIAIPKITMAIFFARVNLDIFGAREIVCNIAGSVIDNVVLVVAPNNAMIYSKSGTVPAKIAER